MVRRLERKDGWRIFLTSLGGWIIPSSPRFGRWMPKWQSASGLGVVLVLGGQMATSQEGGPRWNDSALRNAGRDSFPCETEPAFPDGFFEKPVMVVPYEEQGRRWVVVIGQGGQIWSCSAEPGAAAPDLSLTLSSHFVPEGGDSVRIPLNALGAVFDRDYPRRPFLYVRCTTRNGTPMNRLVRFRVLERTPLQLGESEEILAWQSNGHDGGDLAWGPDGFLYLTAGDGSAPGDPDNIGQQVDRIRGSVLRIDVHGAEGKRLYRIPPDNPFRGQDQVRPELWCYGLRNPWRMSFHPVNGELWLGDNGDEHWEMVHRIERGSNYGWSAFEGSHVFRAANQLKGPTLEHTLPAVEHPHTEMRSVIGGVFYRGQSLPALRGHYLYGCYFTKQLWAFDYREGKAGKPFLIGEVPGQPVDFTEDHDREILVSCFPNHVFRLIPSTSAPAGRPWPATLGATGLFTNTAEQKPARGVIAYRTNAQAWFDGATTERFVAVPEGPPMKQSGGRRLLKSWDFSPGTAIAQTLSLGNRRVETQLLYFDGQWRGFSYRWDEKGTDAELVKAQGEQVEIELPGGETRPWRFHARAECMTCHTQRTNFAISLTTPQLDCPGTDGVNQLDRLVKDRYLQNSPQLRERRGAPTLDPYGESGTLEVRARTYLDLNCAHCHRETGLGGRAGIELRSSLPLEAMGIINRKAMVGLSLGEQSRLVVPRHPERSELLARMNRRGAGQMPLLGSFLVDEEGIRLIRRWIMELPAEAQEGDHPGRGR